MTHAEVARSIDRHFRGRLATADQAAMRAHLPGCGVCRTRYDRHLLYGQLTRRGLSARERLARGLGLRVPSPARPARIWPAAGLAAAAVAALLIFVRVRSTDVERGGDPAARGGRDPGAALWVYRLDPAGAPTLADRRVSAADELAFAYANPGGRRYLSVFAVGERGQIYWYYPAWPAGAPPPQAMRAQAGPGPYELPEAIRHRLAGHRLALYAVFSDEPVSVTAVERAVGAGRGSPDAAIPRGAAVTRRWFEVAP
jgi:hypothetical protein